MSKKKIAHGVDNGEPLGVATATPHKSRQLRAADHAGSGGHPIRTLKTQKDSEDLEDPEDSEGHRGSRTASRYDATQLLALPLPTYLTWAREYTESESELEEANHDDGWHSPMFAFARLCKAHPALSGLGDVAAIRAVDAALRGLGNSPRVDPWGKFFPLAGDPDDIKRDFMASWLSVKFVPFQDVLASAAELARAKPLQPKQGRGKLYERFISLAGALQVLMVDMPILLPTRRVALLLNCNQRTVSDLRKFAIADGLLSIVAPHRFGPKGSKATKFRFAIERFNQLDGDNF